ncbi:mitochondrial carrier domain-containing protein [Hyaloraphidium curvatum]|nr:mitochondrial carrier domain-containing protein [Hyaloraphidium curvatum]
MFAQLDKDGSGTIRVEELRQRLDEMSAAARKLTGKGADESRLKQVAEELMAKADRDGSGEITYPEYEAWILDRERKLYDMFLSVDHDHSGRVSVDELAAGLDRAGIRVPAGDIDRFLRRIDRDGSGDLDFAEVRDAFFFLPGSVDLASAFSFYYNVYDPAAASIDGIVTLTPAPSQAGGALSWLPPAARVFVSGAASGSISRTMTAPADRLRTYYMTSVTSPRPGLGGLAADIRDASAAIAREGGARAFWRGNFVNVCKVIPETSLFFAFKEAMEDRLRQHQGLGEGQNLSGLARFMIGGLAGSCSMFVIYPSDTIRTRMMCLVAADAGASGGGKPGTGQARSFSTLARGSRGYGTAAAAAPPANESLVLRVFRDLWKDGGIAGFYKGAVPACLSIFPYQALNITGYEGAKDFFLGRRAKSEGVDPIKVRLRNTELIACGTFSSTLASMFTYPAYLIRVRLQAQGTPSHPQRYSGVMDCILRTWKKEGIWGLYRGNAVALMKGIPSTSLNFLIYEGVKKYLGS